MRFGFLLVGLAALVFPIPAWGQGERSVSGSVLDPQGGPAVGAMVADFWDAALDETSPATMSPIRGTMTDADGKFTTSIELGDRPIVLLVMDASQKYGGVAVLDLKTSEAPVSVRLEPLTDVKGRFFCQELNRAPGWTNVYVSHKPSGHRLLQCSSMQAAFGFRLPPGEYEFDGYGSDVHRITQVMTLTPGAPSVDMGTIDLRATGIALHTGKAPPPWTITDARGMPVTVQYSDFKGKWVLMEFWGFW